MRISDWSSDVCSSDLNGVSAFFGIAPGMSTISGDDDGKIAASRPRSGERAVRKSGLIGESGDLALRRLLDQAGGGGGANLLITVYDDFIRSEEHTSELQSLMRISYAVFCLKTKQDKN